MIKYPPPQELDAIFGALSDPLRRQLLAELREGERTATQLHGITSISLVAVMRHIGVLESAGLIRTEKRGRIRSCHFQPDQLAVAETWLADMRSFWTQALRQLNDHLDEQTP